MYGELLNIFRKEKIVAILRDVPLEDFETVLKILKEEEIKVIEIALNSKNVEKQFEILKDKYSQDFIVGAGTVITLEGLKFAVENGAKFILTPNIDEEILKEAEKIGILCVCGFFTPSEAIRAKKYSCCPILKLFPAGEMKLSYLKSLKGPIENIECMAVGGVNKGNVTEFLKAGFTSLGIGSSLINNDLIKERKFGELQENIIEIKKLIKNF